MIDGKWAAMGQDRLLIVCDPGELSRIVRERYPRFDVAVSPTYLSGVAALANCRTRCVLVGVNPRFRKLNQAVTGLRRALGPSSRLLLCCLPGGEPNAREALSAGADDYLIYPPTGTELDEALAIPSVGGVTQETKPAEAMPSWEELVKLTSVLSGLGGELKPLLEKLCRLVADSLRTTTARITVGQNIAQVGDPDFEPVLVETISTGGRDQGEILIGPRQKAPFAAIEAEKLRHYGRLIGHLLEVVEQQTKWQSLAMTDEITKLPNRRYLMQALDSLLHRAKVERFRVTVLMFDMDGFKHFNDTYGHGAGDQVLSETARLLRKHCRQHDIVARYAGDEFVAVFWDAEGPRIVGSKHPNDALIVLRRFKKALQSHEFTKLGPEATGRITISGGLSSFPWDAQTGQALIDRADEALLKAKNAGKNRIYLVGAEERPVE